MKNGPNKNHSNLTKLFGGLRLTKRATTPSKIKKASSSQEIPQLAPDLLRYIFKFNSVSENPQLREVSQLFCREWELAAKEQLWHFTPIMQRKRVDETYKILLGRQQREIAYLVEHQEKICTGMFDQRNSATLENIFKKLKNTGNDDLIAYHAREKCVDRINDIIIRNQIAWAKETPISKALDCSDCYITRVSSNLFSDPSLKDFWPTRLWVNFSGNSQLKALPNAIEMCINLEELIIDDNGIEFPDTIQCKKIRKIKAENKKRL